MPSDARRRSDRGRPRLDITVTAPDGRSTATRGLDRWLADAAPARARGAVTVALVSDGRMRALNRTFTGTDAVTDVLSFPVATEAPAPRSPHRDLGDIVIASGVARRQALEVGHSLSQELRVLALHGLLHLLGYDHETDDGRMARVERRLRRRAGLEQGLIARSRRRGSA